MKRGELRPFTLNKGVSNPVCTGPSSSYGKEKSVHDSSASRTTFQILAENCGFKVIKEESKGYFDGHLGKNRSETSVIKATDNASSRWQKDDNQVSKDVIVVSRINNVVDTDSKEQKSMETYVVTRNCEDVAPKVDFLDMTDVSDTLDNCLPTASSKKCSIVREPNSVGEEQSAAEPECQRKSSNGQRRWPRYKIMKPGQGHDKSRSKDDGNKTSEGWKPSSQIVDQLKSPRGADKSKENQPQVFKLASRREKPRILLCDSSSVVSKDGKCVGEKAETESSGIEQCNAQSGEPNGILQAKGSNKENNDGRSVDSQQGGNQAFSNVNSSCLNPGGAQEVRILPPKKNMVGGMLSYLRKMSASESKGRLRDSLSKQGPASNSRFFNRQSENKTAKSKITPHDKDGQILLPNAKLKKKGTSYSQQNMSPRKLNMTPGESKFDIRSCGADTENASTRFPLFYRNTNDVPMCSSVEKGIQSSTFRLDRNRPQDYNINFNSEDGCDDGVSFNSFIGYYLYELWKNQCLCDVRIKVGNTSFLAHKIVLAAFTDIFCPDDPHQIPTVSFDIPDVTEEAVSLILQYLYTSKMEVTDSVLEAVYTAASILEIGEITDLVMELLSKPTVQNFEKYLTIRQRIGLPSNIMDVYNDFVLENLLEIEDSSYILGMQLADMEKLLRDPNVKINCEADIFRVIIKWLKYNPCHRTRHAAELLTLVDFDCIGPETLSSIVEQNRHLFDLASMDIIMGAFKKFALRCKDASTKDVYIYGDVHKGRKPKCFCSNVQTCPKDCTANYSDDEVYEGHKPWLPEPSPMNDRYAPEVEHRSRKTCAVSPQDIRKSARHYCAGQVQVDSTAYKCCSQNEPTKRGSKSCRYNSSNPPPEIQYTIRQKKKLCDSSNNFPSEYCDLRSRSSSSESRRGHFYRCLNSSRSDTDTGQMTPVCECCCMPEGHVGRKRAAYACCGNASGDPDKMNEKCEPECSSNYMAGPRQCREGKKISRRFSCNQVCQRSRSSSLSSGSSLRYNGSSSGSSKRVTFS